MSLLTLGKLEFRVVSEIMGIGEIVLLTLSGSLTCGLEVTVELAIEVGFSENAIKTIRYIPNKN